MSNARLFAARGNPHLGRRRACCTIFAALLLAACDGSAGPPPRPAGVPAAAVWAGGVDGGAWIHCQQSPQGPDAFACTVYNENDPTFTTRGTYVLRRKVTTADSGAGGYAPVPVPSEMSYAAFDGISIHLQDPLRLLPHGRIDHAFGKGHGKRQMFDQGREIGLEVEY